MATGTAAALEASLSERDHAVGCPRGRVESYEARTPHTAKRGPYKGEILTVVRCIECAGQTIVARRGLSLDDQAEEVTV